MKWQAIFFDFDGVILDSVDVKTKAFAKMFSSYGPEIEKKVVEYHMINGGVSRFEKFKYYYKNLLHKPITEEILNDLGNDFKKLALEGVLAAPFIDGALDTLKQLKLKGVPAFVATGAPDEEIKDIVKKRNLSDYFLEIHGSPRKKREIVNDIANRHGYDLTKCLFIGDAMTDYEEAKACETQFLGIVKDRDISPFPDSTTISEKCRLMGSSYNGTTK